VIHVYVAGPLAGNVGRNIREACRWADLLRHEGFVPFVPHLSFFADLLFPRAYEDWIAYDFEWVKRCEALLRLEGASPGADREVGVARACGASVFGDGRMSTPAAFRALLAWRPVAPQGSEAPAAPKTVRDDEALLLYEAVKRETRVMGDPAAFKRTIEEVLERCLNASERAVLAERFKDADREKGE
jgi:hypothetical protein